MLRTGICLGCDKDNYASIFGECGDLNIFTFFVLKSESGKNGTDYNLFTSPLGLLWGRNFTFATLWLRGWVRSHVAKAQQAYLWGWFGLLLFYSFLSNLFAFGRLLFLFYLP